MTSKWRASFTFHRSLDCSCRLLCWASSSAPSAANKIHTTTLRDNCNTTCSFFFFASTHLFYGLIIFYILACLYWELFSFSPSSSPSKLVLSPPSFLRYLLPLFVLFLALEYEEFQHFWRFCLLLLFRKKTSGVLTVPPVSAYILCTLAWCNCSNCRDACKFSIPFFIPVTCIIILLDKFSVFFPLSHLTASSCGLHSNIFFIS